MCSPSVFAQGLQAIWMRQPSRSGASIPSLLAFICPSAIRWRIVTAIIDSIDAVCWGWFRPHVGVEVGERVQPVCADSNTSTAVPLVVRFILIKATLFHARPCLVFWRMSASVRQVCLSARPPFASDTSAGSAVAAWYDGGHAAAVTCCCPITSRPNLVRKRDKRQPALALTASIARFWAFRHAVYFTTFTRGEYS